MEKLFRCHLIIRENMILANATKTSLSYKEINHGKSIERKITSTINMTTQSSPHIITPGIAEALLFAFLLFSIKNTVSSQKAVKAWNGMNIFSSARTTTKIIFRTIKSPFQASLTNDIVGNLAR